MPAYAQYAPMVLAIFLNAPDMTTWTHSKKLQEVSL